MTYLTFYCRKDKKLIKNKRFIMIMTAVIVSFGTLFSCFLFVQNPNIDTATLMTNIKKGAPVFDNSVSRTARSTFGTLADYGVSTGSVCFGGIYNTFKEYDPDISTVDQNIDDSNIWCSLDSTLSSVQGFIDSENTDLTFAPTEISPSINLYDDRSGPYTMGLSYENDEEGTYYLAANILESSTEVLATYNFSENSSESKQVKYVNHDASTGDVIIDINYLVHYTNTNEKYSPRLWVDGNTETNTFDVLAANYGYYDGGTLYPDGIMETIWSMAASGTNSTGGYMIIYYSAEERFDSGQWEETIETDGGTLEFPMTGWYKIPAGAAEGDFDDLYWYDTLAELVSAEGDPEDYGSQVITLIETMFTTEDLDGTSDARMVTSLDDFGANELSIP